MGHYLLPKKVVLKDGRTVVLRHLRWEDFEDILNLFNSVAKEEECIPYLGVMKEISREEYLKVFSNIISRIQRGKEIRIVAEYMGRVVGFASAKLGSDSFRHRAWIGVLVKKGFREVGVGTELLKAIVMESSRVGLKLLLAEVSTLNPRAIHVFTKVGFKKVGKIPYGIILDGKYADTVIMGYAIRNC